MVSFNYVFIIDWLWFTIRVKLFLLHFYFNQFYSIFLVVIILSRALRIGVRYIIVVILVMLFISCCCCYYWQLIVTHFYLLSLLIWVLLQAYYILLLVSLQLLNFLLHQVWFVTLFYSTTVSFNFKPFMTINF